MSYINREALIELVKHLDKNERCKNCYLLPSCDSWVRNATTLYDDYIYSVENCPYYISTADVVKIPDNGIGELSDGYHTFNELYHHRAILFSVICNSNPSRAWKSKLHDTGDMFDGMFIVGIETPQGQATYHYDIEPYWDLFKVKELEKAPKWDGHTPQQAIDRISSIIADVVEVRHGEWVGRCGTGQYDDYYCSLCGMYEEGTRNKDRLGNYCPNCGAKMDRERMI